MRISVDLWTRSLEVTVVMFNKNVEHFGFVKLRVESDCLDLMRRRLVGDEDVGAFVFFVRRDDLFFVVAALGVDFPGVEFEAEFVGGGELHFSGIQEC